MPYKYGSRDVYYIGDRDCEKLTHLRTKTGGPVIYGDLVRKYGRDNKFEDPDFPAGPSILDMDTAGSLLDMAGNFKFPNWDKSIVWKRVEEIAKLMGAKTTEFILDHGLENPYERTRFDVCQGAIGDCWVAASLSVVTMQPELVNFIAPEDNFDNNGSGCYHFRIKKFGVWIDVVVDDYLPVGETGGPNSGEWSYFCCGTPIKDGAAEIWASMAEKAYAKLNGQYSGIVVGDPKCALEDFTDGATDKIDLNLQGVEKVEEAKRILFPRIQHLTFKYKLVLSSDDEIRITLGLQFPHAYSLTGTAVVNYKSAETKLVRIRNPHGKDEWTGPWSDGSVEWNSISEEEKQNVGLVVETDGAFWMTFEEMIKYFHQHQICYSIPESLIPYISDFFACQAFHSSWNKADNTVGAYPGDVHNNPQFEVELKSDIDYATLALSLQNKVEYRVPSSSPVFVLVYRVDDPDKWSAPYGKEFFEANQPLPDAVAAGSSRASINAQLLNGKYVIVPVHGREGQFVLRIAGEIAGEAKLVKGKEVVLSEDVASNELSASASIDTNDDNLGLDALQRGYSSQDSLSQDCIDKFFQELIECEKAADPRVKHGKYPKIVLPSKIF